MRVLINVILIVFIFGCNGFNNDYTSPDIETDTAIHIADTVVQLKGVIVDSGSEEITDAGFYYGLNRGLNELSPFVDAIIEGNVFSAEITGLQKDKDYYFKAFVRTSKETIYDVEVNFYTGELIKDASGNIYKTVHIGDQQWINKNLRTTRYTDGSSLAFDGYSGYGSEDLYTRYGLLYGRGAVFNTKNVCPDGWHIPTHAEWEELKQFVIVSGYKDQEAKALKATTGWDEKNGLDKFGFRAFPGGYIYDGINLESMGESANWWSLEKNDTGYIHKWTMDINADHFYYSLSNDSSLFLSVRCVRDSI